MGLFRQLTRFWRGLCTNWLGTAGVVITTTSFLLFTIAELLRVTGVVTMSVAMKNAPRIRPALRICSTGLA